MTTTYLPIDGLLFFVAGAGDNSPAQSSEPDMFASNIHYRDTLEEAESMIETLMSLNLPLYLYEWPKHRAYAVSVEAPIRDAEKKGMNLKQAYNLN